MRWILIVCMLAPLGCGLSSEGMKRLGVLEARYQTRIEEDETRASELHLRLRGGRGQS